MDIEFTEENLQKLEKELSDIDSLIDELEERSKILKAKKKTLTIQKRRINTHFNDLAREKKYKSIKSIKTGDIFKLNPIGDFKFGNYHFRLPIDNKYIIFNVKVEKETKTGYTLTITTNVFVTYDNYSIKRYSCVNNKFKFNIKKSNFKDILIEHDESFKRSEKLNNLLNDQN